jgi:IS30 family transposase
MSICKIAKKLSRHRSTVFRELKRSGLITRHGYIGCPAQQQYDRNRKRCGPKIKISGTLKNMINSRLLLQWSPEQISGRLKMQGLASIGVETIYRYIYKEKKAGGTLWKNLRHCRSKRKKRFPTPRWPNTIQRLHAENRPQEIDLRLRKGDFERDTVVGAERSGYIITCVDRKTRLVKIVKPESLRAKDIHKATINILSNKKLELKSITNDNGVEFTKHQETSHVLDVPIYFTRPYAAWERGTVENTNKLIRQYLPKSMSFKELSNEKIKMVETMLNQRPRKTLGYKTPMEAHFEDN